MKPTHLLYDTVQHGNCIPLMRNMGARTVDFVLTDPPYLVRYRDRLGRTIRNDGDGNWLKPAFAEIHRVLRQGSFCVSFYGWNSVDQFMEAWKAAGFRVVGHVVFRKRYVSSVRYTRRTHEMAYLLAKGNAIPQSPVADVLDWTYTGNRLHPTEKPLSVLEPLIASYCPPNGVVLDPFCGSGSTLVAAHRQGRWFIGIDVEAVHVQTARSRFDSSG